MKNRILYKADGSVAVVVPAPKSRREGESDQTWLARVFKKANPEKLGFKDVEDSSLPSRRFRSQWVKDASGTVPDLIKSKAQVMLELREIRDKELLRTDGEMAKENEIGTPASVQALKAQRQKLRDLPTVISGKLNPVNTVEDLEQAYPRVLTIENYLSKGI